MDRSKTGEISLVRVKGSSELVFYYFLLALMALIVLAPLYWIFTSTLKNKTEMFEAVSLIPKRFTLSNYISLLRETSYVRWFLNSLLVAVGFTLLGVFFCSLGVSI